MISVSNMITVLTGSGKVVLHMDLVRQSLTLDASGLTSL